MTVNMHAILAGLLSVAHTPEQADHAARSVLEQHAHELAEQQRNHFGVGDAPKVRAHCDPDCGFCQGVTSAADLIDPHAADDPLTVLRAVEDLPRYRLVDGCPHCPDGHTPPDHGQTWGAFVGSERDGDGQPMQIIVARSAGAHVAESDAEWVRRRLNDTSDQLDPTLKEN